MSDIKITCNWSDLKGSPYLRGENIRSKLQLDNIYKNTETGQIRIYSEENFDGVRVNVNKEGSILMKSSGNRGRLHVSEESD